MNFRIKSILKKNRHLVLSVHVSRVLSRALYSQFRLNFIQAFSHLTTFIRDYREFKKSSANPNFDFSASFLYPCLKDKTSSTPLEPTYFYQDTWAAQKIFQLKPSQHYDVGSSATSIGIISQFVPITMVDIRPVELKLNNLFFKAGSILDLPFGDNTIESLSSLCVVEHIGLARYGDPIDPWGAEKAIKELTRVLKKSGDLLISLPIDSANRVYFNAHRSFTRQYVLELFCGMELLEEKYIYGKELTQSYDSAKGFGTGLFHFRK